jgi:hypothetical protein
MVVELQRAAWWPLFSQWVSVGVGGPEPGMGQVPGRLLVSFCSSLILGVPGPLSPLLCPFVPFWLILSEV